MEPLEDGVHVARVRGQVEHLASTRLRIVGPMMTRKVAAARLAHQNEQEIAAHVDVVHHQHELAESGLAEIVGQQLHVTPRELAVCRLLEAGGTAHEIPQEVGDLAILLHSGMSRLRALTLNLLTSITSVVGGVIAYFALGHVTAMLPYALALAASSFLYVAVADLIPGLHRRVDPGSGIRQFIFIVAGVAVIYVGHQLAH